MKYFNLLLNWRGLSSQGSRIITKFGIGVSQHTFENFKKNLSTTCFIQIKKKMNKYSCVLWMDNFNDVCVIYLVTYIRNLQTKIILQMEYFL